jgi:hypothetical protein
MLSRFEARDILSRCVERDMWADFHTLRTHEVEALIREANARGYRKPKDAPGSRGRMFHQYVMRRAARPA